MGARVLAFAAPDEESAAGPGSGPAAAAPPPRKAPKPPRPRTDTSAVAEWRRTADWPILILCAAALCIGALISLAASPAAAARYGQADALYFAARQSAFASGAGLVLVACSLLSAAWVRRLAMAVFLFSFALMAFVLVSGHEAGGAKRWIRVAGFSLQPSELVKPGLIVLVAWFLAQRELYPQGPWAATALALVGSTAGLLLMQPDVGQTVLLAAAFAATFFVSGLSVRLAAAFAGVGAAAAGLVYLSLPHVRRRLTGYFNPQSGDTYQVDRAAQALAEGGLWGRGPGEGGGAGVPDGHTDFVFSVIGNEYGLFAALATVAVLGLIALRGISIASRLTHPYPRAAATGLFTLFGLQVAINLCVNTGLIPPKGMTLPLVSYGGSSLLGTALTLGLAAALIRGRKTPRRRVR